MSGHRGVLRRLALVLAGAMLLTCVTAASAGASFGEVTRFGTKGIGKGQFSERTGTGAFGVDPSDNSVYVGDEPEKGVFRIQKLSPTGAFIAEARFKLKGSEKPPAGIEGI